MVTAQGVTWVTELPVVSGEAVEGQVIPWKRVSIDLSYTQGDDAEKFDMSMAMKQAWDNLAESNLNGIFQVDFDGYIADIHFRCLHTTNILSLYTKHIFLLLLNDIHLHNHNIF